MTTAKATEARRKEVSLCLAKSMTKASDIAKHINSDESTVRNDLYWMRKNATKWLQGHTLDGYVYETQHTIEQLRDIEYELQALRSTEQDLDKKLKIMKELRETINMRWVIQGDGPTLMAQRYTERYGSDGKVTQKTTERVIRQ